MRAVVVGAGIGGLAAAVALHRIGWDVTVLERSDAPGEIGAGISLWPNALKALKALDVWPDIRTAAAMQLGGARRPDGTWLSRMNPDKPPFEVLLVHRAQLWGHLRAALPRDAVLAGATVTDVTPDGALAYRLGDSDVRDEAAVVVAADGLRSTIRGLLAPRHAGVRYAGFTAWRGVTAEPFGLDAAAETWGRGSEFGATIMLDGRVYWFATANRPEGERAADEHAEVLRRFGEWHDPLPAIVRATRPQDVLRHDIHHLAVPLPSFSYGKVALLGDAAHAMTPNLGQGACQALEDAVTLGALLRGYTPRAALPRYDAVRRRRAEKFVALSSRAARVTQAQGRLPVGVRNTSARLVPPRLAGLQVARLVDWRPPSC